MDEKMEKELELEEKKEPGKKGSTAMEWIKTIVIPIIVAILILQVIRPTLVQQQSMMPTVQPNNYLIVYKLAYKLGEPKNGDIIVFKSGLMTEDEKAKYLIKRVIATEGDTIRIADGEVYVNGEQLEEPYINGDYTPGEIPETVVPEDSLFVMGDNRPNSTDSRSEAVGFVGEDTVMGKVVLRLLPLNEIGSVY